ncbi:unnamed protein product [Pedinophyceae sp. YPF-701]|nr:unnamed protein product [Pedinophyceae sp. YPF-701]
MTERVDFNAFLEQLPAAQLERLYASRWTSQAVLRSLPPLAKQYVIRLVQLCRKAGGGREDVSMATLTAWRPFTSDPTIADAEATIREHKQAIERLRRLQIITVQSELQQKEHQISVTINARLLANLRLAMLSGAGTQEAPPPAHVAAAVPSRDQLDRFGEQQWEALLGYLLREADPPALPERIQSALGEPPLDIEALLDSAGLTSVITGRSTMQAQQETRFEFLLRRTHSQLWQVLRALIVDAESRLETDQPTVVGMLLQLSFRSVGLPYRVPARGSPERRILSHLATLGLAMPFLAPPAPDGDHAMDGGDDGDASLWFCPTPLAAVLCSSPGGAAGVDGGAHDGFIIVETNFKVYAYTSSDVHAAVLQQVITPDCRLPNLLVGAITHQSIQGALNAGMSAEAIIRYLEEHAHPKARRREHPVPMAVQRQIQLWQTDMHRVQHHQAVVLSHFGSPDFFRAAWKFARERGMLLYPLPRPRKPQDAEDEPPEGCGEEGGRDTLICRDAGREEMKQWLKNNKARYIAEAQAPAASAPPGGVTR